MPTDYDRIVDDWRSAMERWEKQQRKENRRDWWLIGLCLGVAAIATVDIIGQIIKAVSS